MTPSSGSLRETLTLLLAGGQGERLYPLTRDRTKPAVPFGGSCRIIDFTLSNCLNSGLRRVYVLTQYKSLSLERHLRLGWNLLSEEIGEFIVPVAPQMRLGGSWYRGTADAVFQNIYTLEQERPRYVVILSGDHVYKMDYARMLAAHVERGADLTVGCIEVGPEDASQFGIAQVDGEERIRAFAEKPRDPMPVPGTPDRYLASMGIYVFGTEALVRRVSADAKRESAHDFGRNVIPDMLESGRVFAYRFGEGEAGRRPYWRDIGRIDAYYEANLDLLGERPDFELGDAAWPIRTAPHPAPPVLVRSAPDGPPGSLTGSLASPGTVVAGGSVSRSVLGYDVRVERGASVTDSILFDGVVVGEGAEVRSAIVDKGVAVPAGAVIGRDRESDRERFLVTPAGVVVVPKGHPF